MQQLQQMDIPVGFLETALCQIEECGKVVLDRLRRDRAIQIGAHKRHHAGPYFHGMTQLCEPLQVGAKRIPRQRMVEGSDGVDVRHDDPVLPCCASGEQFP